MTLISKTYWGGMPFDFRIAPVDADVAPVKLRTQDFREIRGLFWDARGGSRKVGVLLMHPRVDFSRHYSIPRFLDASIPVLALNSRSPNDDTDTVHEELVVDVACGVDHLRGELGVERVVLVGNSGGGSLMALFQAQAKRAAGERIARTPGGAPTFLPRAQLNAADALILIAAHRGEGHVLARTIDPSVLDESDLQATDAGFDMYDPANGFALPPEPSRYDAEFVRRYRDAQLARVARIDDTARSLINASREARREKKAAGFDARSFAEQQAVERRLHARHVMVVYRTMANLDYVDPTLDPSARGYGSLLSDRPDLMNRSIPGFARTVTPRAWLSTWSANASNADLVKTLPEIDEPVLALHAERDKEIFPECDVAMIAGAIRAEDRTLGTIEDAGHYFEPPFGQTEAPDVERLMDIVVPWIEARFVG